MEELIKIEPDKERARSLFKLARLRYTKLQTFDPLSENSLLIEGLYEVAKELITSLLFTDGFKTLSHKDLIQSLLRYDFPTVDIMLLDQLRKLRNNIVYYGEEINSGYYTRNKEHIHNVISSLFSQCETRLLE